MKTFKEIFNECNSSAESKPLLLFEQALREVDDIKSISSGSPGSSSDNNLQRRIPPEKQKTVNPPPPKPEEEEKEDPKSPTTIKDPKLGKFVDIYG